MADLIEVTPAVLEEKSTNLTSCANKIRDLINQINSEMQKLSPAWEGKAGGVYVERFKTLGDKVQNRSETIDKYAAFLKEAAEGFSLAENQQAAQNESLQ